MNNKNIEKSRIAQHPVHFLYYQSINFQKHPLILRYTGEIMKSTRFIVVLITFSSILFRACHKEDDAEVAQTGTITGELRLTDEFGNEFSDQSDMVVSVEGKGTGVSGSDGKYEITGLPSGTFELSFEKDGFGTYKRFSIQVIAGPGATALNGIDYLGQKSTTAISNLTATINPVDSTLNIGCSIAPIPDPGTPRAFRLFFGKNNLVSGQDYQYTPSNTWVASTASGLITGLNPEVLYSNGYVPGEWVYLIAYGESIRTNSYTDPVTNKKVFPNINTSSPSNVVSFILP